MSSGITTITMEDILNIDPEDPNKLRVMLRVVAITHNKSIGTRNVWADAVLEKLESVGVKTLQGFLRLVLELNRLLSKAGHHQLHMKTLKHMHNETCDMLFGPIEKEE